MGNDWFRKTTWSSSDEEDFYQRLSRSRGQRAEYLRIQAATLAATGDSKVSAPAKKLAHKYLEENPEGLFRSQAYLSIAKASETANETEDAICAYRAAADIEKHESRVRAAAHIDFLWFVATQGRRELFEEAMATSEASLQDTDLTFPAARFRYFGAIALISQAFGDHAHARRMAEDALEAARSRSPFGRHPDVGTVGDSYPAIRRVLERLAG